MTLEQQVTSLELSKKLKELGVKQESLFYWYQAGNGHIFVAYRDDSFTKGIASAFTASELGEMLPRYCEVTFKNRAEDRKKIRWNCDGNFNETEEATEADARAKMLIYLIENKLLNL